MLVVTGCASQQQYDDLKAQNRLQQQRIVELESNVNASELILSQLRKQLQTLQGRSDIDVGSKNAEITALEKDIENKKKLIARMREQLLRGGIALPMELSVMLQDFAQNNDMVTFDEASGMLKFKSDLLFKLGSVEVTGSAAEAIKALSKIMNSEEAGQFDIVIAGHTDDVPIQKAATKAKHPTNWHLSANRAIAVLNVMTGNNISPKRVSVRGFGEFRPVESNKPGKKGSPANRRVEIFIVPAGT